jgi:hypothetical protein
MRVMLASVAQRTREIGATAGHIVAQFLSEALTLCLVGGRRGEQRGLLGWEGLALVASAGLFFGLSPALRSEERARATPSECSSTAAPR